MRKQLTLPLWTDPAAIPEGFMHSERTALTVAEFADRWFDIYCRPPYRAAYVAKNRRASFRLYLLPELGHLPLTAIDTATLSAVQRSLFARGLSQVTIKTAMGHFAELWKVARMEGLIGGRPHADLVWPRVRKGKPTIFSPSEREKIIGAAIDRRLWYVPQIALMFFAGMRPSEAAGLSWDSLDIDSGRLEIAHALVGNERTEGKTRKSLRSIVVSNRLVRTLVEHRQWCGGRQGPMSLNAHGLPVNTETFAANYFQPFLLSLGMKYRAPYAMRHTYITLALMDGAPAAQVAEYCGTSIQEIERSYLSWIGAVEDPMKRGPASMSRGRAMPARGHLCG